MVNFIISVIILFSPLAFSNGWELEQSSSVSDDYYIYYTDKTSVTLSSVLAKVPENGEVKAVRICCLSSSVPQSIHDELAEFYLRNNEGSLYDNFAKKSFEQAFKTTSLYKELNQALSKAGYKITEYSNEKVLLFNKTTPYSFHADMWFSIEK